MKAWGWISTRRSLEEVVKNAFEETIMKNVPIEQFWSFKWRNGVQNWNLHEKLSKIGSVRNFDFWSMVNAKSQSQMVQGESQRVLVRVGSRFPGRVTGRTVESMTSSYDVSMTWTRADVDMLAWLLTWSDDVIGDVRWHQQHISARGRRVISPPAREGDARNLGGAWWCVQRRMTTRFSGQVDRWTTRPFGRRVYQEDDLEVRNLRQRVRDFSETTETRGGAWQGFGWPDFWVLVARGRGARLWCCLRQARLGFAQIWY